MEKPKRQKTTKIVQLTVMIPKDVDDMARRHMKRKGDLGRRVEAAIRTMYEGNDE